MKGVDKWFEIEYRLEAYRHNAVLAEREAIIQLARGLEPGDDMVALDDLVEAIRARGNDETVG